MLVSPHSIPDQQTLNTDVCIIGAGPAGLAAAQELLDSGLEVILLESGGEEPDAATQQLAAGVSEDTPDLYPDIVWSHDRRFGGTSVQWDVQVHGTKNCHLATFDPIDFKKRDWMPHSGWPIDYDTMHPYYLRALKLWETGIDSLEMAPWVSDERKLLDFKDNTLETKLYMTGSQAALTEGIGGRIKQSQNMRLIMKANAVELDTNEDASTVTGVKVACLDGRRFTIAAKQVILAQGGFQVPRLLLASDRVAKHGLGNDNGLVGRFLMDRQIVKTGTLFPNQPISAFGLYDLQHRGLSHVLGKLAIPQKTLEEHHLMNTSIGLNAQPAFSRVRLAQRLFGRGTTFRSPAYYSLRKIVRDLRARQMPERPLHHLLNVLGGIDDLVFIKVARAPWLQIPYNRDSGGWYDAPHRDQLFKVIDLYQIAEQSPDPDNRITLSDERDATGMRKPKVEFRWRDFDIRSALGTQDIVQKAFEQSGIGRLRVERRDGLPLVTQMTAHHPAGTARMADDPKQGVVDRNCRVHGVSNLYVASSAVFTTGGCAPPTLTIVAMAVRVVDAVKKQLGKG
ncbi:FAD-dependent oxidoreductase [Lautropia mirabilis]|uniref:FAD-dependent oxidoreductase n=1 Tax=Lautropia mirabilis TaxID=47671 RepID=UPI0028E4CFB1|nr:FAD-dependent oxidoreductase [Lautropia mirabilis]